MANEHAEYLRNCADLLTQSGHYMAPDTMRSAATELDRLTAALAEREREMAEARTLLHEAQFEFKTLIDGIAISRIYRGQLEGFIDRANALVTATAPPAGETE